MPELAPNTPWPIAPWGTAYTQWRINDAWWTGNTDRLLELYSGQAVGQVTHRVRGEQFSGGLVGAISSFFWGRPVPLDERRTKLHVPAPADVASLSSDLLFAEPPSFDYPDTVTGTGGTETGSTATDSSRDKRLNALMSSDAARASLAEGGELTSAFGASAMIAAWDDEVADQVYLVPCGADVTVPEFRLGKLTALNAYSEYVDGSTYYRHVERHEVGAVFHTLYQGTRDNLGRIVPLQDRPETAIYAGLVNADGLIETGVDRLTAAWWVNSPARLWRRQGVLAEAGRSDFAGGTLSLFDALDEAWSSWMRDIALGRARLLVDSSYLTPNGAPGEGAAFDLDREVFQAMSIPGNPDRPFVQATQFAIRVNEHAQTTQALYRRILAAAGMGELDKETASATDRTATEVNVQGQSRERTRDRKALYATQMLSDLAQTAMLLDGIKYPGKGGGDFGPVEVSFPPASQQSPLVLAQTAQALRTARAASTQTLVQLVNPTWKMPDVLDEVTRIEGENPAPDPTSVGSPIADAIRDGLSTSTPATDVAGSSGPDSEEQTASAAATSGR